MRRFSSVMFFILAAILSFGLGTHMSGAEQWFGPRAVYSPLHSGESSQQPTQSGPELFALAWQDSVAVTKPVIEEIKKPGRAFFMSVILPGTGQIYAGAKTRGIVLLGVDLASITYALISNGKGNDWTDKYESFADQHWIESKYIDDRADPTEISWYGYWKGWYEANAIEQDLDLLLTHTLPESKEQNYYEMIGKYDQFVYGWDDVHGDPLNLSPDDTLLAPDHDIVTWTDTLHFEPYIADIKSTHRTEYMDLRDKANKAYKRATTMVGVMLFNRVISAIDAARCAKNYNLANAELKTTLHMEVKDYAGERIPQLVLTRRFY